MILAVDAQGAVVGMVALSAPAAGAAGAGSETRDSVHPAFRGRGLYRVLCRCRWLRVAALRMGLRQVEGLTLNPTAAAARLRMGYAAAGRARYTRGLDDVAAK